MLAWCYHNGWKSHNHISFQTSINCTDFGGIQKKIAIFPLESSKQQSHCCHTYNSTLFNKESSKFPFLLISFCKKPLCSVNLQQQKSEGAMPSFGGHKLRRSHLMSQDAGSPLLSNAIRQDTPSYRGEEEEKVEMDEMRREEKEAELLLLLLIRPS